jgi:hypothetical protein
MKSILYSCSPERARKILNGEATLDIRKSIPKDFVGWVYMYVTKAKPYITMQSKTQFTVREDNGYTNLINGLVVARWWFDEFDTYYLERPLNLEITYRGNGSKNGCEYTKETKIELLKKSFLTFQQIWDYGKKRFDNRQSMVYAWHIKQLEIFDKPMELGEFYTKIPFFEDGKWTKEEYERAFGKWALMDKLEMNEKRKLTKAPQSWQYVWVKE